MHGRNPILIVREHDGLRAAQRFVALLCLSEFYVSFVIFGMGVWGQKATLFGNGVVIHAVATASASLVLFVGTSIFYLTGRGLWQSGRRAYSWGVFGLWGIAIFIFMYLGLGTLNYLNLEIEFHWADISHLTWQEQLHAVMFSIEAILTYLPIWLTLHCLRRCEIAANRDSLSERAPWVSCAIAYCCVDILKSLVDQGVSSGGFRLLLVDLIGLSVGIEAAIGLYVSLLVLLIALLIIRSSKARLAIMIIAAINGVTVFCQWFVMALLVRTAIGALLNSVGFSTPVDNPVSWTRHDVIGLLVAPVRHFFPWLLILFYAWRVPMWAPADDGSPFPRVYCAKCLYNLHSNKKDRCPECGSDLDMQSQAESTG